MVNSNKILLKSLRKRRSIAAVLIALLFLLFQFTLESGDKNQSAEPDQTPKDVLSESNEPLFLAIDELEKLEVKGRAAKTGYSRSQFSNGWAVVDGCDVRNLILARDLAQIELESDGCSVLAGILADPYTDNEIIFVRGAETSSEVQIDHVVALSDAWQKGAQQLTPDERLQFSNDSLNLLSVDGEANQQKGDSDAASWLPPNKDYRCRYIARQVSVKAKYRLWVTEAEKSAMKRVLKTCPDQSSLS